MLLLQKTVFRLSPLLVLLSCWCLLVSGGSGGSQTAGKKKSKAVTTVIDAKWHSTPLVLEVAEYLAEEGSHLFWQFVDAVSQMQPPLSHISTEKAAYDAALDLVRQGDILSAGQVSVMKLALSLRAHSPRVQMYSQMAAERGMAGCANGVDLAGDLLCSPDKLDDHIDAVLKKDPKLVTRLETFRLDHYYPGADNRSVVAILYGELGTPGFAEFHEILKKRAAKGEIDYVLRHHVKEASNKRVRLSGYGVELHMKSTEYKAEDDTKVSDKEKGGEGQPEDDEEEIEGFNFSKLKQMYPDKKEELDKLRQELLETSDELAPLKVWQFQELSLQAAQRIVSAPIEEAIKILTHISQNFPMQAKSLVKTRVNPEMKKEIKMNQDIFANTLNLQPADTALFINGMFFEAENIDMMTILDTIRQELNIMEGLYKIGISDKSTLSKLLALDFSTATGREYAIDIRDSAIQWANDIEADKKYKRWPSSLLELLRPTFPGMLRSIRRNIYNLVIIGDPSQRAVWPLIKMAESFHLHSSPLRIGLVFAVNSTKGTGLNHAGVALLNAFNYVAETKDSFDALSFVTDVYASIKEPDRDVLPGDVYKLLRSRFPSSDPDEVLGADTDYDTGRQLAADFVRKSGFRTFPQVLLNGIPLAESTLTADDFEDSVFSEVMIQTPTLQKAVYKGELSDTMNVLDFIMDQPNVMPRSSGRIRVGFIANPSSSDTKLDRLVVAAYETLTADQAAVKIKRMLADYDDIAAGKKDHSDYDLTNVDWPSVDRKVEEHRSFAKQVAWLEGGQLGIITNGRLLGPLADDEEFTVDDYGLLERFSLSAHVEKIHKTLNEASKYSSIRKSSRSQTCSRTTCTREMAAFMNLRGVKLYRDHRDISPDLSKGLIRFESKNNVDWPSVDRKVEEHRSFAKQVAWLEGGQLGIITNGRLLGPLADDEEFTVDDYGLLERFSLSAHVEKIHKTLNEGVEPGEDMVSSDVLMKTVSLLVARPQTKSRFQVKAAGEKHSVIHLPAAVAEQPAFDITVIVDPVSRGAQKMAPILTVLRHVVNCHIRIFLNCLEKNSDMPLKSFYRYVLEPEVQFTADGHLASGPYAKFTNMPGAPLLTQNMHVPENWLVESIVSPYDLDNIRLEEVESAVHSQFELEHLLLEGHCFEATMGNPPRGLQMTLGTETQPVVVDTIVMANLGYFQLKANPGAWLLRLRQGRSAEIFDITSHEGSDTPVNSTDIKVLISSFRSHVLKLRVTKKPDKIGMDLLGEDDDSQPGLWNSITSTFGSTKEEQVEAETINIFSVASGHLYERFLRIMMLSVLKNTKSPVKFWFLKNYLSPTFKDFLPRMSKEYGFQYELVQYKWPRWLHQQTEKQRIIWGYKILFLDVLFPLDVKKIIFVDADQVVRADMKELVDLDLGGAPYGYTPFCESRTTMDGFRFWKHGYWRNHLQGRRYHISALYVVDLRRFRKIAAGDRLRGQYQALSQDPNSLSNLDQDLPNNMIHQVAIKSLPQEWLWCETWCDDESKKSAKTIDLCNNPLTKEAKLTAAMRIVDEWKDYDAEIKALQLKLGATEEHEEEDHSDQQTHDKNQDKTSGHAHSEL
ncbi:UDP-glucose:glycoprotein glucosyltransferase [Nilaparvata lugens]|uniref:UDP-glucose:glycoprotein glucosyltransferase n=1 Tax=Nilaparvata lugens TaxID=108931 RepID=UPI00193E6D90|nr:UDP-glucose:glycoprotein glucosyltransferase [Nilaparvata lugens]